MRRGPVACTSATAMDQHITPDGDAAGVASDNTSYTSRNTVPFGPPIYMLYLLAENALWTCPLCAKQWHTDGGAKMMFHLYHCHRDHRDCDKLLKTASHGM